MTDSLRDQIARRLAKIRNHEMERIQAEFQEPDKFPGRTMLTVNRAVADEVIRLMEWIRSEAYDRIGGAAEDSADAVLEMLLTLPPEDWKP